MILAPCAFAIFSSKDKEEPKGVTTRRTGSNRDGSASSWRSTSASGEYDLVLQKDPAVARPKASAVPAVFVSAPAAQKTRAANSLLSAAANAEADSIVAQVYAAQAAKAAAAAMARAASARAAAATALAIEAERAVAEATRLAAAVRRAYETAPPSVGPKNHALPETHPSMDFPRSHVIHRAA
jgi:hypothetical protein